MTDSPFPISLPTLSYGLEELEPIVSAEIMHLHLNNHHQTYVNNFNKALEKHKECVAHGDIAGMISHQKAIEFNGGGHLNHSIFWTNLAPYKNREQQKPSDQLMHQIRGDFTDLSDLIEQMNQAAISIQGSGWAWLGYGKKSRKLAVATCANQDPLALKGLIPLFGIDVWEHAYYLQYKSARANYVQKIWEIVNWSNVSSRFEKAKTQ